MGQPFIRRHDLKILIDWQVVANGGIRTDPWGRNKLNLATTRPNLSVFSPIGEALDRVGLARSLQKISIRHLALTADGVAFAMQCQGDGSEPVPQIGLWTPGQRLDRAHPMWKKRSP